MGLRSLSFICVLGVVALAASPLYAILDNGEKAKDIFPERSWNDNGKPRLSDHRGEYVFVVTWAKW